MKAQVVVFVCSVLVDLMLMSEAAKFPSDSRVLPANQAPGSPGSASDLNSASTTNSESFSLMKGPGRKRLFERYSSSSFGGLFPSPYWNNNNRNNYNSWPYPYNPGFQPNPNYNPSNPYNPEPYNPYYPYNYFGGSYGGGNYGSSNPIGAIGAAKPGTSKVHRN